MDPKLNNIKECEGCFVFKTLDANQVCSFLKSEYTECPCSKCLVKIMCKLICPEFTISIRKLYNEKMKKREE